jgi:ribose 5-phosphate isomerase B
MKDTTTSFPHEIGILICGSGQGMAMRANKYPQIRAALCWDEGIAKLSREHNDANVLCLGARNTDSESSLKILHTFLSTDFAAGRHRQRVVKVATPV